MIDSEVTKLPEEIKPPKKIWLIVFIIFLVVSISTFAFLYFSKGKVLIKNKKISVVSDIPEFSLQIKDLDLVNKYLDKFGFWNKQAIQVFKSNEAKTAEKLVVHLTDKQQPYFESLVEEIIVRSVDGYWNEGTFHLLLYFDPAGLRENPKPSFSFDRFFLQVIHSLTLKEDDIELVDKEFKEIFTEFSKNDYSLFLIKEK